jgi:acetyl esterase/lipase
MKVRRADQPSLFEQASPDRRVTPSAPPMFVFHGANDTLVPPPVGRYFAEQLRRTSASPVAYLELPRAQHAFDVMASIRSRHTTMGAVQFLEGIRARVPPDRAKPPVTSTFVRNAAPGARHAGKFLT